VDEVIAVVRRGPAEVKFTRKEMETVGANIDLPAMEAEFARVAPIMQAVGQDPAIIKAAFLDALPKAIPPVSQTRFRFEFLATPVRVLGDWMNGVNALKVEENTLLAVDGNIKARGTSNTRQIDVDTIIFAIGDTVDKDFCVPIFNDAYMAVPQPRFPVDGISFEACNPDNNQPIEHVFLAGWARLASTGLVGVARRDGERAAQAILAYLQSQPPMRDLENVIEKFEQRLDETHQRVVDKSHLAKLEEVELAEARKLGVEEYKLATNDEMFTAMGF
jgi:ferredoxin--NADP+ reductase